MAGKKAAKGREGGGGRAGLAVSSGHKAGQGTGHAREVFRG